MRPMFLFLSVLVLGAAPAAAWTGDQDGFVPLFDGKTFHGWEGNRKSFRIEDGAIVGGTLKDRVPRNEFLTTKKQYGDFELRLKFKLLGKGANAGVQIRSQRVPKHHEMIGYQADLGDGWWGCLYDESRRRKVLAGPPRTERDKPVQRDEWNDYRIRCEGRRIQLWINGRKTVDYTEADKSIPQTGLIGLQIHGGPPTEAWYKDIRIRLLNVTTAKVTGRVTFNGKPLPTAKVLFRPEKGRSAAGTTDESGAYTLSTFHAGDGALIGEHRVTISVHPSESGKAKVALPKKYSDAKQSALQVTVSDGKNVIDFDLAD